MTIRYTVSRAQYNALEGLAHWVYQSARCRAENDAMGEQQARETLDTFPECLDRLQIPFWVQNAVACWAEDYRAPGNIRVAYMDQALARRGIGCAR